MTPAIKLQRAKIALLLDQPFFGSLLLGLRCEQVKTGSLNTCATDGERLLWDAAFLDKLNERELSTVLAHEALHCALLHPLRRGDRDMQDWNIACDHAINNILEQSNEEAKSKGRAEPFPWPKLEGIPKDPQHRGKAAEEIYYHMEPLPKPPGQNGNGGGSPGMGDVMDAPGDEAQKQVTEATWKVALIQAAQAAKGQGKLPADMARLVDEIINPTTPWQEILRSFVRENCKDDYSWTRPNPRYAASGFILPSLHSQRLGKLAVAIDTSGSIDATLLNAFLGEVETIAHECRPSSILLIDCDAQVNSVRDCEATDPLPRDFKGGGGTDFRPVFERLDQESETPVALIYLTDLEGDFPDNEPAYPTLWATLENKQAPFGQTIKIER